MHFFIDTEASSTYMEFSPNANFITAKRLLGHYLWTLVFVISYISVKNNHKNKKMEWDCSSYRNWVKCMINKQIYDTFSLKTCIFLVLKVK